MQKDVYLCFIFCAKTFDNLRHTITEKKNSIYLGNISQYYRDITRSRPPAHKYTMNVLYKKKGPKRSVCFHIGFIQYLQRDDRKKTICYWWAV